MDAFTPKMLQKMVDAYDKERHLARQQAMMLHQIWNNHLILICTTILQMDAIEKLDQPNDALSNSHAFLMQNLIQSADYIKALLQKDKTRQTDPIFRDELKAYRKRNDRAARQKIIKTYTPMINRFLSRIGLQFKGL